MDSSAKPNKVKSSEPRVTVVITAFNRVEYVREAVDSVLGQFSNKSEVQVIVLKNFVDEKLDGYLTVRHVTIIQAGPGNQGKLTLVGERFATNEVVCYLDDDDLFLPGKIDRVIEVFQGDPEIGFYHNAFEVWDMNRERMGNSWRKRLKEPLAIKVNSSKELRFVLGNGAHINMSSICVKKKIIEDAENIFDRISSSNDDAVLFSSIDSGYKLYLDSAVLTKYRVHDSESHRYKNRDNYVRHTSELMSKRIESYSILFNSVKKTYLKQACRVRIKRDQMLKEAMADTQDKRVLFTKILDFIKCSNGFLNRTDIAILVASFLLFLGRKLSVTFIYLLSSRVLIA